MEALCIIGLILCSAGFLIFGVIFLICICENLSVGAIFSAFGVCCLFAVFILAICECWLSIKKECNANESFYTDYYVPIKADLDTGDVYYVDHELKVHNLEGTDRLVDRENSVMRVRTRKPMEYKGFGFKEFRKDELVEKKPDMKIWNNEMVERYNEIDKKLDKLEKALDTPEK